MATATITPDQTAVIAEIFIAAPPARVFQAISDPAQLPKWWGQSDLYHVTKSTMDVRPGGKWRSDGVGADGKTFYVEGEYLESTRLACSSTPGSAATAARRRPSCAGNSSPTAFTDCTPAAPASPAPARWSAFARKVSPATSN